MSRNYFDPIFFRVIELPTLFFMRVHGNISKKANSRKESPKFLIPGRSVKSAVKLKYFSRKQAPLMLLTN